MLPTSLAPRRPLDPARRPSHARHACAPAHMDRKSVTLKSFARAARATVSVTSTNRSWSRGGSNGGPPPSRPPPPPEPRGRQGGGGTERREGQIRGGRWGVRGTRLGLARGMSCLSVRTLTVAGLGLEIRDSRRPYCDAPAVTPLL